MISGVLACFKNGVRKTAKKRQKLDCYRIFEEFSLFQKWREADGYGSFEHYIKKMHPVFLLARNCYHNKIYGD